MGEIPQAPLTRGGIPPLVLSPHSCLRHSVNVDGVQWPYHFPKTNDGPVSMGELYRNNLGMIGYLDPDEMSHFVCNALCEKKMQ